MSEHQREIEAKKVKPDEKRNFQGQVSKPALDQSQDYDIGPFSSTKIPFHPGMTPTATLSKIPSPSQRHEFVMRLHQTHGNRYVQGLIKSGQVQAKLTVSTPDDVYEQQADRVSETVIKAISSSAQRQEEEEELFQSKTQLYRQGEEEEEIQTERAMGVRKEDGLFRTAPAADSQYQGTDNNTQVSVTLESQILAARHGGEPITGGIRRTMEEAFNADFSGVRTHTDSQAASLSQSLQARAFTTGNDIFFQRGEYNPGSESGQRLLAHELTHTIQQTGRTERVYRWGNPPGSKPAGTTHIKVTEDAFKSLAPKYEFWYSPEAQKHLAERSEDLDVRWGVLISSWGVGQIFGQAYKTWRDLQKGVSHLGRGLRSAGRGLRRFLGWTGEKLGITREQHEKEQIENPGGFKGTMASISSGTRRAIGWTGEKLGITSKESEEKAIEDAKSQQELLAKRARDDYDNISWYWRAESEAPNHAEAGKYRSTGGEEEDKKRIDEYVENAGADYDSGDTTQSLEMLAFALHAAEDRGAHGDGDPGTGHDPRRVTPPPEGARTAGYYDDSLNPDGKDCDRKEKNSVGYAVSITYAKDVLRNFLDRIGVFKDGAQVTNRQALIKGGRLGGYKQPGGLKTFLRKVGTFFGKDVIGIGSSKSTANPEE